VAIRLDLQLQPMAYGGRDDRIRYDSPKFYGFQLSASHLQGGAHDYAVNYSGKWGEFKTAAAVGFAKLSSTETSTDNRLSGSASVLHDPSGVSLTFAAGRADLKDGSRNTPKFFYGKLGYQGNWFGVGNTAIAVDLARMDDQAQNGDEFTTVGVGAVQELPDWGTEFYAGYRNYALERAGTDFEDIDASMVGARVKF